MHNFIVTAKAISDPNRLRALMVLRTGELCVCQINELLQLAPSTISKHMSILRNAGLVTGKKHGRWMYYRLPEKLDTRTRKTLLWIISSNENDHIVKKDFKRIISIKKKFVAPEYC